MSKEQAPHSSQRLSRTERRALEQKQQKELRSKSFWERHAKKIYASAVATVGGAAIVGGVIFLRGQDGRVPLPPTAIAQQSNSEQSQNKNLQIIDQETKRLKIKANLKEENMWASSSFDISSPKIAPSETAEPEIKRRLNEVEILMKQSENPYFQQAMKTMDKLANSNKISVSITSGIQSDNLDKLYKGKTGKPGGGTRPIVNDNGDVNYELLISAEYLLNNSNALDVAFFVTHELEHVNQLLEFEKSFDPSFTPEQKKTSIYDYDANAPDALDKEIEAYAVEAQALTYQIGIGIRGRVDTKGLERAARFISSGSNPESEGWRNYVASEIMSLK